MICASPLAVQALTYWRNSNRLALAPASIEARLERMNAYATLGHVTKVAQSPRIRDTARRRLEALGTWRPVDATIYAMPLKADNPLIRRERK